MDTKNINTVVIKRGQAERNVHPARRFSAWPFQRMLSGKRGVMLMIDISAKVTEQWWGHELTPTQARELAVSLNNMANEVENAERQDKLARWEASK